MNRIAAQRVLQAVAAAASRGAPSSQALISAAGASSLHAAGQWPLVAPALQRSLHASSHLWHAQAQPVEKEASAKAGASGEGASATGATIGGAQEGASSKGSDEGASSSGGGAKSQDEEGAGAKSSGGSSRGFDAQALWQTVQKDLRETLSPVQGLRSYTKKYKGAPYQAPEGDYNGTSAISVVKPQQTPWQKAWNSAHKRVAHIPILAKLLGFKVQDTSAYKKGEEFVADLKEKYETSDHPMVHKVEDFKERVFSGSEASQAMHEIRTRDPAFDMNLFLRSIKLDAPIVTKAFLKHDMASLSDHCGPEIMQRLEGLCAALKQQELHEDPTILFVGDAEVVEVRVMDGDPFVIAQFHCQQLKCVRDKFGNVVEGSPDTIHRVYYFWGLQQEKAGVVTADGELLPPRWVIKDMLWQSMLALI